MVTVKYKKSPIIVTSAFLIMLGLLALASTMDTNEIDPRRGLTIQGQSELALRKNMGTGVYAAFNIVTGLLVFSWGLNRRMIFDDNGTLPSHRKVEIQ